MNDGAGSYSPVACQQCAAPVAPGTLACPRCGGLVFRDTLERIAADALRAEAADPLAAANVWQHALPLLPPGSEPFRRTAERMNALYAAASQAGGRPTVLPYRSRAADAPGETWQSVLVKTGGSMALSVFLYSQMGGWDFAVGFVLLIFVHEMGHVVANWHYGIRQSAPIFMGIFGAVIFVRGEIPGAKEEAVMGIAGPVFGSVAALGCYAWFLRTGDPLARELAYWGLFINAWNLIPMPPLDGGRTAAAITPWLWAVGLAGIVGSELLYIWSRVQAGRNVGTFGILILVWILSQTLPRVRATLLGGQWRHPYYRVGWRPRLAITAVYLGLAVVLLGCLGRLEGLI